ncbi:MAG: ATP-binding protein [Nevskia sp.]|uniref:ATP-binding protein n=1 Tax=Nevskia sp. TaxID=1929292 RepID=UPI004035DACD
MSTSTDEFSALLARVSAALEAEQRISYRGLKRRFALSDDDIDDLKDELIHARRVAEDENGIVLVWRQPGAAASAPAPAVAVPAADAARAVPPLAGRPPAYTPRHLADKILSMRSAIEGEKKQVTVLFCDTANSTVLAERLGPEGFHETMNAFFAGLTEAVHRLEGTVNQFTGDGAIALFGAPLAHEDHAYRACMAALRLRDATATLDARLQAEYGLRFSIRIGLNSGEVVVGTIGDDLRMDYTAQGHVVAIAARLEAQATGDRILMSEHCHRQVRGMCEVRSIGSPPLKGVSEPIEVFELLSARPSANRFDMSRSRGLTRFVGREADLAVLESALARARKGHGAVLGVVAEAGTGKSRLFHEFIASCRARGMTVHVGRALSHGANMPYLPMLQVFRSYYGIEELEDPASARDKIAGKLMRVGPEFIDYAPLVAELLGVADAAQPPVQIDPDAKQRRLFELLRRLIQGADPMSGSVITCFEDLHWMDPASERFLEEWIEAQAGGNQLLLLNFRPGYQAEWMKKSYYQQISLAPLASDAVSAMLSDLIGDDPTTAGLADDIFRRSGGNPFFCEEIVQSLRESGDLVMAPARIQLRQPLSALRIPASVQSILAARIDRLPDAEKSLLQIAAVIGREFAPALVRHVMDLAPAVFDRLIERLRDGEFIHGTHEGNRSALTFKHALTQEVAINSQLRDKRRLTHMMVAQGIESLHADRLGDMASLRAWHWQQAGEALKAALAYGEAAVQIRSGNRIQQLDYIRKALELSAALPSSPPRQQLRLQCLVELIVGGAWRFSMTDGELEVLCNEARELAEAFGMKELALMIRAGRAAASGMMAGDIQAWRQAIETLAGQCAEAPPEVSGTIIGQYSYALYASGRLREGLAFARQSEAMCNDDPRFGLAMGYSVLGAMQNCLGLLYTSLGQLDEARAIYSRALAMLPPAGIIEELLWNQANQSESELPRGLPADDPQVMRSVALSSIAVERADQVASDFTRGVAKRAWLVALLMQQRHEEAVQAAIDCLDHLRTRRAHLEVEARCLAYFADALRGVGRHAEARVAALEAVQCSRERGARYFESCALLCLGHCEIAEPAAGREAAARTAFEQALAIARDIGAAALEPQIIEALADQQARLGDAGAARAGRLAALDGYRAVSASGHAARLAAALG